MMMEIKDKPASMTVREWITKKIATDIMIPERDIRQVISHQFDAAYEAVSKYNSIEISGFGKFFYNTKKADKEIEHCLSQKDAYEEILDNSSTTEKKRQQIEIRLGQVKQKLFHLIKKRDGYEQS